MLNPHIEIIIKLIGLNKNPTKINIFLVAINLKTKVKKKSNKMEASIESKITILIHQVNFLIKIFSVPLDLVKQKVQECQISILKIFISKNYRKKFLSMMKTQ